MPSFPNLRRAARTVLRAPAWAVIATLSIGLGAGVNTALYSVFRAVFLQPPSAVEPTRLVRIEPGNGNQMSYPNVRDMAIGDPFEGATAYATTRVSLWRDGDVEKVRAMAVSPQFFDVLGLAPSLGLPAGGMSEGVVITSAFARRRLPDLADPRGAVLTLNDRVFSVVGVLPESYRAVTGAVAPDLYVPIVEVFAPGLDDRGHAALTMMARLGPGTSVEQGRAALSAQLQALERAHPDVNAGLARDVFVFPVTGLAGWQTRDVPAAAVRGVAAVPFAVFGLVLLIACANVSGLLLARGAARRREIGIRLALGASRLQVVTTLLAESLVLAVLGAAIGLLLAYGLCQAIETAFVAQMPGLTAITPDWAVFVYSIGLAAGVTLACGLLPALASTRLRVSDIVRRDSGPRQRLTSRRLLVIGQIGVATLLLFISILVLRSLLHIRDVDPGFLVEGVHTVDVDIDEGRYTEPDRRRLASELVDAVRALPGVSSASITSLIPLAGDVVSRGYAVGQSDDLREAFVANVGPEYFQTMGIGLHAGRDFSSADGMGAPPLAIVNRAFVTAHGLSGNPFGVYIRDGSREPPLEIVGVVNDTKYAFFGERPQPIVYRPFAQTGGRVIVVARSEATPGSLRGALTRTIRTQAPGALVTVQSMRDATRMELRARRIGATILGALGALGLGLALIGLYGLMSYKVTRHMHELGIRVALGASRRQVHGFVLGDAMMLVGFGATVGTAAALLVTRPLAFLMGGIETADAATIVATVSLVMGAGLVASYVPSRRATRVDPLAALRSE